MGVAEGSRGQLYSNLAVLPCCSVSSLPAEDRGQCLFVGHELIMQTGGKPRERDKREQGRKKKKDRQVRNRERATEVM